MAAPLYSNPDYDPNVKGGDKDWDVSQNPIIQAAVAAQAREDQAKVNAPASTSGNGKISYGAISQLVAPNTLSDSPQSQITKNIVASDTNNVIGTEFGEVDRPGPGSTMAKWDPTDWSKGKWGHDLTGADNEGIALPENVLRNYGNYNKSDFADNFNSMFDVVVSNPQTGTSTVAPLKDFGPGKSTGAGIDLLSGTRSKLGYEQNFKAPVSYQIVPKGSAGDFSGIGMGGTAQPPGEAPLAPWDLLNQNPQTLTIGALFQQQQQRETGQPTVIPTAGQGAVTGSTIGTSPAATYPTFTRASDLRQGTRPEFFGMRVASADDVAQFDQYVANGNDPSQLDPYDQLAVALAKDPKFLTKPENINTLQDLVLNPLKTQYGKMSTGEKVNNAIQGFGTGVGEMVGDIRNYVGEEFKNTIPSLRYVFAKATGQVPDQDSANAFAEQAATHSQGLAKLITDVNGLVSGIGLGVQRLDTNIAETFTADPAKKAQLEQQYALAQQSNVRNMDNMFDLGNSLQSLQANAYTWLGGTGDMAQKIQQAQPDPKAVEGFSQLTQLLPVDLLAVKGLQLFKPMMFEKVLQSSEEAAIAGARKYTFDRVQAVPPNVAEEAANPGYTAARNVQSSMAGDTRAANAAFDQAQNDLASHLTSMQKIAGDPGTVTQFTANLAQAAGQGAQVVGDVAAKVSGVGDRILNMTSFGNPTFRAIQEKVLRATLFGLGAHWGHAFMGRLVEAGLDVAEELPHLPEATSAMADLLKTYGKEKLYGEATTPFWTRVSEGTKLINPRLASFLDSPAILTGYQMGKGMAGGMAVGGAIGALASPDDPVAGLVSGMGFGGVFGMAGGGFHQWQRYADPATHWKALRADWKRSSDMMSTADKQSFLQLPSKDQLMIGTYLQQHPGLRVNFVNDPAGVSGSYAKAGVGAEKPFVPSTEFQNVPEWAAVPPGGQYKINPATGTSQARWDTPPGPEQVVDKRTGKAQTAAAPPGPEPAAAGTARGSTIHYFDEANRPTIQINTADPESTVRALFSHELMHHAQSSGMMPDVYDALLGNPNRGTIGQYTALDPKGDPLGVNPDTGRYVANQQFTNWKNQYTRDVARAGHSTSQLSDLDIAKEIYAEHGADYLLSTKGYVEGSSAFRPGWINSEGMKKALAAVGFTFDQGGNMVRGSGLFDGMQRNDALDKLTSQYLRKRFDDRKIAGESDATRRFNKGDLQGNAPDVFLNSAPEIMRNADGSVMRDKNTGSPIMRSPREVKEYNGKLASDIFDRISALPADQKMAIGHEIQPNGNLFVRYLPKDTLDALAKTNEYNPHQIGGLSALSEMLADQTKMGTNFRLFYHKALTENKRYASFSGTEKFAVPYGFEITKGDNVNLRSVDFAQLTNNYLKNAKRAPFSNLWANPGEFTQDANTYFQNHAQNLHGEDNGVGIQKKDAINSLLGLETQLHRESNPLVGEAGSPRARSIIKSYRIDRASQITPLEKTSPFTTVEQYRRMNMNYRPRRTAVGAEGEGAPTGPAPDENAIPVTMRTTSTGKTVPTKIDYGITSAPLVADKQPTGPTTENNFGHIDFLTKPDQQKLTHLDSASAVTSYADKLVDEFGKWQGNKDVMSAKTWYTKVRGYLKKGFGDDQELFAHLLAATSPRQGVVENWNDAFEAYQRYKAGAFDDAIKQYKATGKITEDMKPTKANGAKFGMNSDAVLKVLSGTWLDTVEGPKTPNFFANLFGRGKEATIDSWAARTMRRLGNEGVEGAPAQWRLTPPSETGVSNLDFAFSQQVFRQAADRLKLDPHELQAIMWYAEKHHWAERGYSKGGAAAAKASYIPMLKEYAESVAASRGK